MSELNGRGVRDYSELSFGESLSKVARHQLACLCIKSIRDELGHNPKRGKGKGRGRPHSPMGILAIKMAVHIDSVKRWMDLEEIQASDYNATRLAEMAFKYSPEGVVRILQEDIARRRETMNKWLTEAQSNNPASPYMVNSRPCPYCDEILPDEDGLNQHIIELHTGNLATEVREYT